jgi:uncharacterized membrane protein YagU involved in acid resistance
MAKFDIFYDHLGMHFGHLLYVWSISVFKAFVVGFFSLHFGNPYQGKSGKP